MKRIKIEKVPVCDLRGIVNVVSHNTDAFTHQINRIIKHQRHNAVCVGLLAVLVGVSEYRRAQLDNKVYNLEVRVKRLEKGDEEV